MGCITRQVGKVYHYCYTSVLNVRIKVVIRLVMGARPDNIHDFAVDRHYRGLNGFGNVINFYVYFVAKMRDAGRGFDVSTKIYI